jgi:hypothetical protein
MPSAITRLKRMLPTTVIHFQSLSIPQAKTITIWIRLPTLNEAALP